MSLDCPLFRRGFFCGKWPCEIFYRQNVSHQYCCEDLDHLYGYQFLFYTDTKYEIFIAHIQNIKRCAVVTEVGIRMSADDQGEQKKTLSLIVPILNEEQAIPIFLSAIRKVADEIAERFNISLQILFINDGSNDPSALVIEAERKNDDRICLINLTRNFGKEAAIFAGLTMADGDAAIPIDVDLQDPPEVIPLMIEKWLSGANIVNARREERRHDSWMKRTSAGMFYRIYNAVSDVPMPTNVGDFRLLDRKVIDVIRKMGEHSRFNKAIFSWVGFHPEEISYSRPARSAGESSWSYWKLWKLALDALFSASTLPLRVWSYFGFIISVLAFAYMLFIVFYTMVMGVDAPGYASTIVIILLFGGLNLLSIGILGEYISRIYLEVRQRPLFIIDTTLGIEERQE
jgi:glycosyltransferase involved in cell wall biosynthesis